MIMTIDCFGLRVHGGQKVPYRYLKTTKATEAAAIKFL